MNILLYGVLPTIALIAALIGGFLFVNRPQLVLIDAQPPAGFPVAGFSHDSFEDLLAVYVDERGNVDYARWHGNALDRSALEAYLSAVARYSPDNAPERFDSRSERLAYWLYAYNAYVIWSVIDHWPVASVTDVKAPIEAVTGLGFFYRQRFLFGEEASSLYSVEHDKILNVFKDPRVHFVLNCASESCPVLRPELPAGDALEKLLVSATEDFVNDVRNVRVDHNSEQIVLSTIFKWYKKDFENDLRRRGLAVNNGVIDYIKDVASHSLQNELIVAQDYDILFEDYDWSLNTSRPASAHEWKEAPDALQ